MASSGWLAFESHCDTVSSHSHRCSLFLLVKCSSNRIKTSCNAFLFSVFFCRYKSSPQYFCSFHVLCYSLEVMIEFRNIFNLFYTSQHSCILAFLGPSTGIYSSCWSTQTLLFMKVIYRFLSKNLFPVQIFYWWLYSLDGMNETTFKSSKIYINFPPFLFYKIQIFQI